jgi:MFS family permease
MNVPKILSIFLLCLVCFGLGNAWTIVPSISNMLLTNSAYQISHEGYAGLTVYLVIGALLTSFLTSEISRFFGTKLTILSGLLFNSISMIILVFVKPDGNPYLSNVFLLSISQFFLGMGIGSILTSISAYLAISLKRFIAMGITGVFTCVNLGSSTCANIVGSKIVQENWWYIAGLISCYFVFLILICFFLLKNIVNPSPQSRNKLSLIFCNLPNRYWIFPIVIFLYSIIEISYSSWGVIFLHEAKGISIHSSNEALSIFWATVGVCQLIVCALISIVPFQKIYRVLPVFLIISLFGQLFSSNTLVTLALFALAGIGCSAFFSLTINLGEFEFKKIAELISGTIVIGYFLGQAAGSLIIGFAHKFVSISIVYGFIGFISVLIAVINYRITRKAN